MSDVTASVQPVSDAVPIPEVDSKSTKPPEPPQTSSSAQDNSREENTEAPEEEEDATGGAVSNVEEAGTKREEAGNGVKIREEHKENEAVDRIRQSSTASNAPAKLSSQERQNVQSQKDRDYLFGLSQRVLKPENQPKPSASSSDESSRLKSHRMSSSLSVDATTDPALQLSHLEQLLGTTKEILRVLVEQRNTKAFDVERDAAMNEATTAGRRALKKFLQINQPWDLVGRDNDWDWGMPQSRLEELVTEAERHSNALGHLCEDIFRNSSAISLLSVEQATWLIKRLVVLNATSSGSYVLDRDSVGKTTESMRSWFLAFFESFNRINSGLNLETVNQLPRVILALVRCTGLLTPQMGHVMLQCRKDGIFSELNSLAGLKEDDCQKYFRLIAKADCCLNFTSKAFANASEHVAKALTIAELLSINIYKLSSLWVLTDSSLVNPLDAIIRKVQTLESNEVDPNSDTVKLLGGLIKAVDFETEDLNVERLTTIGGLTVEWTMFFDQHLVLNKQDKTLRVGWFAAPPPFSPNEEQRKKDTVLKDWYVESLQSSTLLPDQNGGVSVSVALNRELYRTWTLLFRSSEKKVQEDLRKSYKELKAPSWFGKSSNKSTTTVLAPESASKSWTGDFHFDTETAHRHSIAVLDARKLDYSSFSIYEQRLRALRTYMDSVKPRGLLQLWRDNRDSLSYYTFWGVIIFGGLSFLVAFFSLTVSVSQTVASFKALHTS